MVIQGTFHRSIDETIQQIHKAFCPSDGVLVGKSCIAGVFSETDVIIYKMGQPTEKWAADRIAKQEDEIGGAWLAREYNITPVQPLRYVSKIAKTRSTYSDGGVWRVHHQEPYRPEPTLIGHLEFMLKHERIHLEFLSRLFSVIPEEEIAGWARSRPKAKYARKAGFLYEWLTGRELDFGGVGKESYIDALEQNLYLTASEAIRVRRWCVNDNLPGNRFFCPTVLMTEPVQEAMGYDFQACWRNLEEEFGADLIARSAVWLTVKESRASFAIEGETDHEDRMKRFAAVLEAEVGHHDDLLEEPTLLYIQRALLGEKATRYGSRKSPIFVGQSHLAHQIVHYIGPHWDEAHKMMSGLAATEKRTRGRNSLVRAAVLSFGFIYIHPLGDGNGRISRFLINDTFRRDGALQEPFVLPVSAVISAATRDYDRALEQFSKPLMKRYRDAYRFGKSKIYEDGIESNFEFDSYEDAEPAWRYLDLTDHVGYLHDVVRVTVDKEMRDEARQMRAFYASRRALNEIIEGPDQDLDRIIRSVTVQPWAVSNKLRAQFPLLDDEETASKIVQVIKDAFELA